MESTEWGDGDLSDLKDLLPSGSEDSYPVRAGREPFPGALFWVRNFPFLPPVSHSVLPGLEASSKGTEGPGFLGRHIIKI